ncbi:MAG: asparaginase [Rhodospirillales bacterium]|nr:asparaginase [Rhodospirillales bacterium]
MKAGRRGPLVVECTRGPAVESRHLVDAAVVDTAGRLVQGWGETDGVVYPRSAIKSVQVLPLIETGAAERHAVTDEEIAVACSSHNGQPDHVTVVRNWLERAGLGEDDLECGPHLPYHTPSAHACVRSGKKGRAVHNMCSGKHSAFLVTARALGEPTQGYIARDHPVQQRVSAAIAALSGHDLSGAPWAIDGCSIPTIGLPLSGLARAAARIADPTGLPDERRAAIARVRRAVAAHPFMVAGDGRACTRIIETAGERVLVKFGAEGVFFAAFYESGLGLALKVRDGAKRAADAAVGAMLDRLGVLDDRDREALADMLERPLRNWAGRLVGAVRTAQDA